MNPPILIGCGNLGENILRGFLENKKNIIALDNNQKILNKIRKEKSKFIKIISKVEHLSETENLDTIMLCVKPKDVEVILRKIAFFLKKDIKIISFVAGLSENRIKSFFNNKITVVRLMPNLLIKINASTTGAFSSKLKLSEKNNIQNQLSFMGDIIWLRNEEQMDFFTSFFGGGPAYVSLFIEVLTEILIKKKIDKMTSKKLVLNLIHGTLTLLKTNNFDCDDLMNKVASKKGTTEAALKVLNKNKNFYSLIQKAILAAEQKSKKISKDL